MVYKVVIGGRAKRQLDKLPDLVKSNVLTAIQDLQQLTAQAPQVKKLKKPLIGYRKRVGRHRILFDIENEETIVIYKIKHRKDAYK